MSMRAVIAMPDTDPLPAPDAPPQGFFGRLLNRGPRPRFSGVYVHSAGRPSELGPLLFALVRHRGVDRVRQELLLDNPAGWSSLYFFQETERCRDWDGRTVVGVDEHQENFNADRPDSGPVSYRGDPVRDLGFSKPPITDRSDKMGALSIWVLCRDEAVLFRVDDDGFDQRELGRYAWSEEPDWNAVDEVFAATFSS